ncbi:MAG: methyl-accepting chemotaxis protein [Candidatus Omnitrophota bacterium]
MINNNPQEHRRKILIIDREFQNIFIVKFFTMVALGSMMTGLIVYAFCGRTLTTVFQDSRLKIMSTSDFILPGLALSTMIVIFVVGVATAFMALYVSHRIAGPVYRLRQDLLTFHAGNLKQIFRLRDKDEMKPLAGALNEMARKMQQDIAVLKTETEALEKGWQEQGVPVQARECVARMKKILDCYHV